MFEERICKNCSPKGKLLENNHKGEPYKDIFVWECCVCHFKTYYDKSNKEITKEEVFTKYPELLEERKNRISEVKKHVNCTCASKPEDMWCWNKPGVYCEIKTIWEEIQGKCTNPMSVKEHIDEILSKHPDVIMKETKVKMTVEITVNDEVTLERFGKPADKTTMGEYRELLLKSLEEAPFQVDKVGLI